MARVRPSGAWPGGAGPAALARAAGGIHTSQISMRTWENLPAHVPPPPNVVISAYTF
jgi:hypothetical protein